MTPPLQSNESGARDMARHVGAAALQLYSIEETSELLNVSRWQVYQLLNRGELKSVKIGRRRLIPHLDVVAFIQKRLRGATV